MKRVGKPTFFVVTLFIMVFTLISIIGFSTFYGDIEHVVIKGTQQIRWGIDIRGGVDVTFSPEEGHDATKEELEAAAEVMRQRLVTLGITDYEVYTDGTSNSIIVRFPWKEGETEFNEQAAIKELGDTALLTFREGKNVDDEGLPTGVTLENIILEGRDVQKAEAVYSPTDSTGTSYQHQVLLTLHDTGKQKFSEATTRLADQNGVISIWMDDTMISAPSVSTAITDGSAVITGDFEAEDAKALANKINAGALPFRLVTENYSTIDPILGLGARDAMVLAGVISFFLICIFMVAYYRLSGMVACIALVGQFSFMLAALTGFFHNSSSFTLTIPGIAGIILSIGIGVDANIITAERIREEIRSGKSLDGAIHLGYQRAFSAILDGNLTNVIVAFVLLGTFGPPDSAFSVWMKPFLFMFSSTTEGAMYSFGYTLLIGVLANFIFAVFASNLMTKSIAQFRCFRHPRWYGGKKHAS